MRHSSNKIQWVLPKAEESLYKTAYLQQVIAHIEATLKRTEIQKVSEKVEKKL